MQRRLFLTKTIAGLLLPLVPGTSIPGIASAGTWLSGGATPAVSKTAISHESATLARLTAQLGTLEQLQLDYAYSPDHTTLDQLAELIQADFAQLTGAANVPNDTFDTDSLFAKARSAQYGSFGHSFQLGKVAVRCRVMARVGLPDAPPQRRSQWLGTLGVVACTDNSITHLDLSGRVLTHLDRSTHPIA